LPARSNPARRILDAKQCPPPASKPARVARSTAAVLRPWALLPSGRTLSRIGSRRVVFCYGFIPPSTATSSAKQLIAAACSANLRHVCAISTRMVLSEAMGVLRASRRQSMAFCRYSSRVLTIVLSRTIPRDVSRESAAKTRRASSPALRGWPPRKCVLAKNRRLAWSQ